MMIKYRVHEVAKDLNVPNKEVLDILAKYVKEPKKHMTALEEMVWSFKDVPVSSPIMLRML